MKRKFNKKQITFVLIAICLVGLIGLGVSYSYYLASIRTSNEENKSTDISTLGITSVVMDMQGKISSNGAYPGHKMVKEVVVRGIGVENAKPANASIKITPDLGGSFETYGASDVIWKLYKSEEVITCSSTLHKEGNIYEESTCNIPTSASLVLEGTSGTKYKNIVVSPNTETKYYLVVEYANRDDENQSDQMGKSFSVDIGLQEKLETLTTNNLLTDSISQLLAKNTIELSSDDPDNNVRYIGADPSNYVYFNCSDYNNQTADTCEKWRIIGLFNNITKSDGTKENLVKIFRDDSIGEFSWDSSDSSVNSGYGVNDWTDADLMKLLNPGYDSLSVGGSLYYNAKSGICYDGESNATISCDFTSTGLKNDTTRNAIEEVVWNLGGISTDSTPSGIYADERGTDVCAVGRPTIWTGRVGLIYPSDYGYATAGGTIKNRETCLTKDLYFWDESDVSDCKNNNYLYNSSADKLTLAPHYRREHSAVALYSWGHIDTVDAQFPGDVHPSLYLKSSVSFKKGTGTSNDPYQLNIE